MLNNEYSLQKYLEDVKDNIEQYFISHNAIKGLKFLEFTHMENWKHQTEQNFQYGFRQMIKSQYFQELTPQIKSKFLEEMLSNEIKFFSSLFQNDVENAINIRIIT